MGVRGTGKEALGVKATLEDKTWRWDGAGALWCLRLVARSVVLNSLLRAFTKRSHVDDNHA